jgi:large subunit ribosomal protein L19
MPELKGGSNMDALKLIAQDSMKQELPFVKIGDTVKVHVRIKEGERERIQLFEGTVIAKKHGGIEETFTVRRVAHGVGIERVFPIHSPTVAKVEVVRQGRVRRAKLYYLRDRVGKAAKVKEARHYSTTGACLQVPFFLFI